MTPDLATPEDQQWAADRMQAVGASESACLFGAHPYLSPLALYYRKRGLVDDKIENEEAALWGLLLEEPIAKEYSRRTGRTVRRHPQGEFVISASEPWMGCTPDYYQTAPVGDGILQIKTASAWLEDSWDDGIPLGYQVQLQHELRVTGYPRATLAVLFGGQRLAWFDIERNEPFMAVLSEKCRRFMECVQRGERPEVDGSDVTERALRMLHPRDNGTSIALPAEADDWTAMIEEAEATIKAGESIKKTMRNRLREAMGEASIGETPGGIVWTNRADKNGKRALKRSEGK